MAAIGYSGINAQAKTITGNITESSPQSFEDGGTVTIGGADDVTNYAIDYKYDKTNGVALTVSGGTELNIDNAVISQLPCETQFLIEDGTVNLTNKSKVDMTDTVTLILNGGDKASTLNIGDESTFIAASNSLWLYSNGSININDKSSFCTSMSSNALTGVYGGYRTLLGIGAGTAKISVTNESSFESGASRFISNWSNSSVTEITVDNSKFVQTELIQSDNTTQTTSFICDSGTTSEGEKARLINDCYTYIYASNNGEVDFQSQLTYIGAEGDKEAGNTSKTAYFTIDSSSSMSFKRMEIYADTNITNSGTFSATDVVVHDGAKLTFNMTPEGVVLMEADKLVIKEGGALIIQQAEDVAPALTFGLQDAVTAQLDADLTLESGSVFTLNFGAVDLNGHVLTIEDGAIINTIGLTDGDGDGKLTLFTNFTGAQSESYNIILNGAQTQITYDSTTGNITTGAIPEPTTSTLSLLALTALATRRRRR